MRMLTRGRSLPGLTAVLAILVWCVLLVHLGVHHHGDSNHCLLCDSGQFYPANTAPTSTAAAVAVGYVVNPALTPVSLESFLQLAPRSPPLFSDYQDC